MIVRSNPRPALFARIHLVELEDLRGFPASWRDAGTAFLAIALRLSGHAAVVASRIDRFRRAVGEDRILDLGSGGGGPMAVIAAAQPDLRIHLSDLHPNREAFAAAAAASGGRITYAEQPVDATRVPADLPGLRTMVNAFHHLPPSLARAVLQDAVDEGRPIRVVEVVSRSPLQLLGLLTVERAEGWTREIGSFPLGAHPVYGVFLEGRPRAA